MTQIVFLNERSHPTAADHSERCRAVIDEFVAMMLALRKVMPDLALITRDPLPDVAIGAGYSIRDWLVDQATQRERRAFLLSLGQRAPFRIAREMFGDPDPGATEYEFDGDPFDGSVMEGVGLAHMYGGFAVSFGHDERWRLLHVPLRYLRYTEQGDERGTCSATHAAGSAQVAVHHDWLKGCVRRTVRNAADLWGRRETLFPGLAFAPGVEDGLRGLEVRAFRQVAPWLYAMNDAVQSWTPSIAPAPAYPPHCTDESGSRKDLCWFEDVDGKKRCFSWHGRYTPGPGRIHFRLDATVRKVVIGYIGPKLES